MTDEFVFEEDVLQCRLDPKECARKRRFFVEQTCWPQAAKLIRCERGTYFPLCLTERNDHIQCLRATRADIEAKLAAQVQNNAQKQEQ